MGECRSPSFPLSLAGRLTTLADDPVIVPPRLLTKAVTSVTVRPGTDRRLKRARKPCHLRGDGPRLPLLRAV